MDVISKEHRERGQASIYNIICAFCSNKATWKSKTNHKPSYYCDEHLEKNIVSYNAQRVKQEA